MKDNKKQSIWAIIPAKNEQEKIAGVVAGCIKQNANVVVVDDGSDDNTAYAAEKAGAVVLRHKVNLGKGSALKTGCVYAIKKGAKEIITIDADGQHRPGDIPKFLDGLKKSDIVFGYRKLNRDMPLLLRIGNWGIYFITKVLFGVNILDTQCGYRAFKAEIFEKIKWESLDYSMESEVISKVAKKRISYTQTEIDTIYADRYKGTTVIDGIKIVLNILWWRITG